MVSQRSLRARHADNPWVPLNGHAQGARSRFERALEHVVRVATPDTVDVQVELRGFG